MNAELTCTECGSSIECSSDARREVNGSVECECGARFAVTLTLLTEPSV